MAEKPEAFSRYRTTKPMMIAKTADLVAKDSKIIHNGY
jgi:hypothetical protein